MKNIFKIAIFTFFILAMVGCAKKVHKDWFAAGGSRADGTVKMVYTYNPQTEQPITSEAQAVELAAQKCQIWGYDHAEPFGGAITQCTTQTFQPFAGMVCTQMTVTAEFQCIGTPAKDGTATLPTKRKNSSFSKNKTKTEDLP